MRKFRATGRHAHTLADGRQIQPGETVSLDEKDLHNVALIEDGHVLEVVPKTAKTTTEESQS